jgi:hypothetical protein
MGTPTAAALQVVGVKLLASAQPQRTVMVVTDGMADDTKATVAEIKRLREQGIEVIGVCQGGLEPWMGEQFGEDWFNISADSDDLETVCAALDLRWLTTLKIEATQSRRRRSALAA